MTKQSVFQSIEGRNAIRSFYNGILNMLPIHKKTVATAYGDTFVLEAGDLNKPTVVLLHGSCSNSAAWLGDMSALASLYHVVAVDIPGEPGNSAEYRLDFQSGDHARWLHETLNALGIAKAAIIGNSMGGWIALQFAAAYPAKVTALGLIAASGIVEPSNDFIRQVADIDTQKDGMKAVSDTMTAHAALPQEVLAFMALVTEHFRPYTGALCVVTDEQMKHLDMPVLYLAGTGDMTMDVQAAAKRLTALVPHAKLVLQEGSHIITASAQHIIPFLMQ
ncbi:MAG TPA: alpha/beta hydrolase [Candidatus Limiplasma sp.]|nr:alpha/beta hydrolase [Candidatus Limiplasma sp.]HRX08377.1 alpha/beta hydrolase [Candidatus Limiplasma sp.]